MVKRQKPERKKLHRFVSQSSTKADKMEKIGARGGGDGYGMKSKHHQRLAHAHHERTQGSQATYHSMYVEMGDGRPNNWSVDGWLFHHSENR
jgi:hypothetical protein